jgi:hypothetical protein
MMTFIVRDGDVPPTITTEMESIIIALNAYPISYDADVVIADESMVRAITNPREMIDPPLSTRPPPGELEIFAV